MFLGGSRPVTAWLSTIGIWNVGWTPTAAQYMDGSPIDRYAFFMLLLLGLGVLITRSPKAAKVLRLNIPIIIFIVYCGISVLWSDFPAVAVKRWVKCVGDVVMVLIVVTDRDPVCAIKRLLSRTGFLIIPLSILFIKYYPYLGRVYTRWEGELLTTGVTGDKNTLGMLCMLYGLTAVWRLVEPSRPEEVVSTRSRVAHGTILLMSLWLLVQANSATSKMCFLITVVLVIATSRFGLVRRPVVLHSIVAAMIVCCVVALFIAPELLVAVGRNPTLTGRTMIWGERAFVGHKSAAWDRLWQFLVGAAGPETLEHVSGRRPVSPE